MKIEWNKVTWYSKLLAVIVYVVTAGTFFWIGMVYGSANTQVKNVAIASPNTSPSASFAGWKTYKNDQIGFEVQYPSALIITTTVANGNGIEMTNGTIGFNIELGDEKNYSSLIRSNAQTELINGVSVIVGTSTLDHGMQAITSAFVNVSGTQKMFWIDMEASSDDASGIATLNHMLSTFQIIRPGD